jgi:hypothetical protein
VVPGRSELHFAAIDEQLRAVDEACLVGREDIDHAATAFQSGVLAPRV